MATPPRVSFVIPTLNSARTLDDCLDSISGQDYPGDRVEIILADAGSTDRTLDIAAAHGVSRVVENRLKTGEAGKSAGIKAATGELIALVDSDNILDGNDWLHRMVRPFADYEIVGAEPVRFTRRDNDAPLTRYFAMLGMNDPVCLFMGNYDRECGITGRWTGMSIEQEEHDGYFKLLLEKRQLPTIGANGFMIRKSLLDSVTWEPYFFDIDIVPQAIDAGFRNFAKVDCGIVHLYCARMKEFAAKQDRRVRDYLFFSGSRQRSYPWSLRARSGVLRFSLSTVTILPLVWQVIRGYSRRHDTAWWYHVPACWITLWIYGAAALRTTLGLQPKPRTRESWQAVPD